MKSKLFILIFSFTLFLSFIGNAETGTSIFDSQKEEKTVKDTPKYRIVTENWPPFNFVENGKLTGFSVDVMRGILDILGLGKIPVELMTWDKAYNTAMKEPDTIIFSIVRTPEREDKFKWVGPITTNYWNLYSLKRIEGKELDINIESLEDAKKYSIGAQINSSISDYLKRWGFTNINYSHTAEEVVEKLLNFKTQLIAASDIDVYYILKRLYLSPSKIKCVYKISHTSLYIGFNKNIPDEVIQSFKDALEKLKNSGKYGKIVDKYYEADLAKLYFL